MMYFSTVAVLLFTVFISETWLFVDGSAVRCVDWEGHYVDEGESFRSRLDPCETCTCEEGHSVRCMSVYCAPPECQMYQEIEGECCQFHCPEVADAPPTNIVNEQDMMDNANLGLRLVAGTVTTVLIVALVLFMIHRLRQRRILIMMRRMHEEQGADDTVAYMSQFDHIDMGLEHPHYEDPPPPYTPPKPSDIPPGKPPPPYEPVSNNNTGEGDDQGHQPLIGNGISNGRPVQGNGSIGPMSQTLPRPAGGVMSPAGALMWQSLQGSCSRRHGDGIRNSDRQSVAETRRSNSFDSDEKPPEYSVSEALDSDGESVAGQQAEGHSGHPTSTPHSLSADQSNSYKIQNPHMHLIKKSDSIEIRRGNCSPRNSFVTEGGSQRPTGQGSPKSHSQNPCDVTKPSKAGHKPGGPSSHGNRGMKSANRENQGVDLMSDSFESQRRPQDLPNSVDAILEASPVRDSTPPLTEVKEIVDSTDSTLSESSPSSSSQCSTAVHSPVSPTQQQAMGRSASAHSQFSVCSETGEKKPPKMSLPLAISNDAQYPLSPLSCKQPGPVHPVIPHSGSLRKNKSSRNSNKDETSPNNRNPSEQATNDERLSRSNAPTRSVPPRISYVDLNCNDVIPTTSSTPLSTSVTDQPDSPQPTRNNVKRSSSGRSSTGNRNGDSGEDSGHGTLRKTKQRRRRSRGSTGAGDAVEKIEMNGHCTQVSQSPDRYKRSGKPRTSSESKSYKQYGLIDDPESLGDEELANGDCSPLKSNHHRSHSREKHDGSLSRENSCERRRSSERRRNDRSHQSEQRKNDRSTSRERKKRNHSLMNGHAVDVSGVVNKENCRKQSESVNGTASMDRKRKRRSNEQRGHIPDQLVNAIYSNGHVEHVIADPELNEAHHRREKPIKSSYHNNMDNHVTVGGHKHTSPER